MKIIDNHCQLNCLNLLKTFRFILKEDALEKLLKLLRLVLSNNISLGNYEILENKVLFTKNEHFLMIS